MMTYKQFASRYLEMTKGDYFEALMHAKNALRHARNEMINAETVEDYEDASDLASRLSAAVEYLNTVDEGSGYGAFEG